MSPAESQPPSAVASDEGSAPLHFVLSVGTAAATPAGPSLAHASALQAGEPQAGERSSEAVYGEDGVDERPRLMTWQAPRYPASAASAGVEVDVPLEVV